MSALRAFWVFTALPVWGIIMLFTSVMKDNKSFLRCFRKGRYCADKFIVCYYYPNEGAENELGLSVSKKIGNAVTRNRFKRICRAAYRLKEQELPIGYDMVFVARQGVQEKSSADIEEFIVNKLAPSINRSFNKKAKK